MNNSNFSNDNHNNIHNKCHLKYKDYKSYLSNPTIPKPKRNQKVVMSPRTKVLELVQHLLKKTMEILKIFTKYHLVLEEVSF